MVIEEVLDRQIDEQPKEVFYCTKCVNSNQLPRMRFDENGVDKIAYINTNWKKTSSSNRDFIIESSFYRVFQLKQWYKLLVKDPEAQVH